MRRKSETVQRRKRIAGLATTRANFQRLAALNFVRAKMPRIWNAIVAESYRRYPAETKQIRERIDLSFLYRKKGKKI